MWKFLLWLLLTTFVVAGAKAHDLSEGVGVVCDTLDQIQQFATLNATTEAIQTINAGKTVCAMVNVRYIRGAEVARVRSKEHAYAVIQILVVQVKVYGQWGQIPPEVQYTLFQIEELGA